MKKCIPVLGLLIFLMIICGHVSAYLTARTALAWNFSIADKPTPPLAFSISDTQIIPTDTGHLITVTFSPIPGPKSVTLTIPSTQSSLLSSPPLPSSEGGEEETDETIQKEHQQ